MPFFIAIELVAETRDPEIGRLLRLVAEDFLKSERGPTNQQQQQIQPDQEKKLGDTRDVS
jgi:hypothetical protein